MSVTGKPAQIADALFAHAAALVIGSPALPMSFPEPGEPFTPPADGKYLTVQIFPNRPRWEGVSAGVLDQGLLQVSVVWPKNQGVIAPSEAAADVMAHFAKNTVLVSGEARVKIHQEPYTAPPLIDADKVTIPVTIPWAA